jgi:hypothetical protein
MIGETRGYDAILAEVIYRDASDYFATRFPELENFSSQLGEPYDLASMAAVLTKVIVTRKGDPSYIHGHVAITRAASDHLTGETSRDVG